MDAGDFVLACDTVLSKVFVSISGVFLISLLSLTLLLHFSLLAAHGY